MFSQFGARRAVGVAAGMLRGPRFDRTKLKTACGMSVPRMRIRRNMKDNFVAAKRREVAELLRQNKITHAAIQVEALVRDKWLVEALDILPIYVRILENHIQFICESTSCPTECLEAACTLIWASLRVENIQELATIREQLELKFGKAFVEQAKGGYMVNQNILLKMGTTKPPQHVIDNELKKIQNETNEDPSATRLRREAEEAEKRRLEEQRRLEQQRREEEESRLEEERKRELQRQRYIAWQRQCQQDLLDLESRESDVRQLIMEGEESGRNMLLRDLSVRSRSLQIKEYTDQQLSALLASEVSDRHRVEEEASQRFNSLTESIKYQLQLLAYFQQQMASLCQYTDAAADTIMQDEHQGWSSLMQQAEEQRVHIEWFILGKQALFEGEHNGRCRVVATEQQEYDEMLQYEMWRRHVVADCDSKLVKLIGDESGARAALWSQYANANNLFKTSEVYHRKTTQEFVGRKHHLEETEAQARHVICTKEENEWTDIWQQIEFELLLGEVGRKYFKKLREMTQRRLAEVIDNEGIARDNVNNEENTKWVEIERYITFTTQMSNYQSQSRNSRSIWSQGEGGPTVTPPPNNKPIQSLSPLQQQPNMSSLAPPHRYSPSQHKQLTPTTTNNSSSGQAAPESVDAILQQMVAASSVHNPTLTQPQPQPHHQHANIHTPLKPEVTQVSNPSPTTSAQPQEADQATVVSHAGSSNTSEYSFSLPPPTPHNRPPIVPFIPLPPKSDTTTTQSAVRLNYPNYYDAPPMPALEEISPPCSVATGSLYPTVTSLQRGIMA